jgi:transcriptional antiterminator NusG
MEKFFEPKPMVTRVDVGDIVELISGPFRGERARVTRVDVKKEEITVELFEATVPIPVTVRGDSIKVLRKEIEDEQEAE